MWQLLRGGFEGLQDDVSNREINVWQFYLERTVVLGLLLLLVGAAVSEGP